MLMRRPDRGPSPAARDGPEALSGGQGGEGFPASASFSRSWTTSVPADRIASRNGARSPRSWRAPVTTYSRAALRRSRTPASPAGLATGHAPDALSPTGFPGRSRSIV